MGFRPLFKQPWVMSLSSNPSVCLILNHVSQFQEKLWLTLSSENDSCSVTNCDLKCFIHMYALIHTEFKGKNYTLCDTWAHWVVTQWRKNDHYLNSSNYLKIWIAEFHPPKGRGLTGTLQNASAGAGAVVLTSLLPKPDTYHQRYREKHPWHSCSTIKD